MDNKRELFLGSWHDAVADVCYYDRKEDEELGREDVRRLIEDGHITLKDILNAVATELRKHYPDMLDGDANGN